MKLLIKYPTRGRKDKFFTTLDKYHEYCSDIENTTFLISIDSDDIDMNNEDTIKKITEYKNTKLVIGYSLSKIDAINRDLSDFAYDWDIVLIAADDTIPQIIGYDNIIRDNMLFNYPDTDGILWFNDGFQGNMLNTLCILGKKYYQRFNYIYHPDYKSVWSDNEFMAVGNILKKQSYIDQVIIKHEHPFWGYGPTDYVHDTNEKDSNHDINLFQTRLSNNFYLIKNMNTLKINDTEYDMSSPSGLEFKNKYITSFGDEPLPKVNVTWNHVEGFYLSLNSDSDKEFLVKIFDKNNSLLYQTILKNGMYAKLNRKYYNGIRYEIYYNSTLISQETISFKGKKVYISFESSSLGDTISWMPYCEEFRKVNECDLVVTTFHNYFFEKIYQNIVFVPAGVIVQNINAMFSIGWFYDEDKEPKCPSTIPLQKTITNILGSEFKELQSNVYFEPKKRPYDEKYICIATNSTAGCKLWNNPNGWTELVLHLKGLGYKIINISKDGDKIKEVINLKDDSMENTMNVIHHSEFVIGLSSGLSWLSWALGKHVVMISNFTESDHEFTINCTRITNNKVCNGCWNNPMFKFDKGDWYWCPEHKGTERQFECHKSITADMVINQIQHLLK
jgi:autotransporter strand-loop-strand O-heptosyltransferase